MVNFFLMNGLAIAAIYFYIKWSDSERSNKNYQESLNNLYQEQKENKELIQDQRITINDLREKISFLEKMPSNNLSIDKGLKNKAWDDLEGI